MSLPIPSITLPLPSITPPPDPSDPGESSTPAPEPSDPPSSSGGGSSVNPSSGGGSSGGGSSGGPSSSGGGSSSAEPSSSEESSTETTLSETSTSVFESLSVITSDGRTLTTSVLVTTIVEPGTVITAPAHTGGASANVGAIVGGVIGGLVGLVALVGLIFFLLKRRRKNFDKEFDGNFDPDYVSKHNTGGPLAFTTAGGAALATATGAHRKSHSLEKAGRQRVNLNNADRASLEAAALAEDDGMGGRLDASTVGGGIVTPFPFPQGQGGPQGGGYSGHQTPYNPAMSPPPMSMNSLPPASPPSGPNMGLAGMGAAGAAGYYAGHHQQQGHHGQPGYGYGQQPYGQGYPDRHGAISPSTTDHSYPNSANPYLAGAPSSNGHGGAYGGFVDPSNQSVYGGVAPSVTGTSASGYGPPPHAGTFGGAGAAMSSAASTHSSAGTGGPAGALSYTTGSGAMSAKEREARGMRPTGGLGVVNPDERPENRRAEGSAGSVLPSPFDAALGGGASGGKAAEANANSRNGQGGLIVHQDGGRVRQQEEDESAPGEIPPAYDSVLYGK